MIMPYASPAILTLTPESQRSTSGAYEALLRLQGWPQAPYFTGKACGIVSRSRLGSRPELLLAHGEVDVDIVLLFSWCSFNTSNSREETKCEENYSVVCERGVCLFRSFLF